jgi:hypothetical protein
MAVAVTNSPIVSFNTQATKTFNAATSSTINEVEVFTITMTKADYKTVFEIYNGTGHGAITYSIAAGGFNNSIAAKTGSVAAGATIIIELEGAKYKKAAKTVLVTLAPATGKRLATDHASGMSVIELL